MTCKVGGAVARGHAASVVGVTDLKDKTSTFRNPGENTVRSYGRGESH